VWADFPGFTEPIRMISKSTGKGHTHDVTGYKDGLRFFKIETADSVTNEHTYNKWKLFASHAETNKSIVLFGFTQRGSGNGQKEITGVEPAGSSMSSLNILFNIILNQKESL
jgi:hypothetical protein